MNATGCVVNSPRSLGSRCRYAGWVLATVTIVLLLSSVLSSEAGYGGPLFVFRYDDVAPATGDPKRDAANYQADEGVIDVFRRNGVAVTMGVIPYVGDRSVLDDRRLTESLRRAVADGSAEVALHGYRHTDWHLHAVSSEWAGVSYEQQRQWLKEGKGVLEKTVAAPVTTFVPPYNTYDRNTLRALANTGFRHISGWLGEPSGGFGMHFVPWGAYRDPVETAKAAFAGRQPNVTVFMTHRADYNGRRRSPNGWDDLQALARFIQWLKSFGGEIVTVSRAAELLPAETSATKYQVALVGNKGAAIARRALGRVYGGAEESVTTLNKAVYWPHKVYAVWRLVLYLAVILVGTAGALLGRVLLGVRMVRRIWVAWTGLLAFAAVALLYVGVHARLGHEDTKQLQIGALLAAAFATGMATDI